MKAFLILENGTMFEGISIGSTQDVISEIVFNTSMTGYLEVITDPSYAGQAVVMTYPLIGNYGVCKEDMVSSKSWTDGLIVGELSRISSNFRSELSIQQFLENNRIPGISGIDTRALTKILRDNGTMKGMITTQEDLVFEEILKKIKAYKTPNLVKKVTCKEVTRLKGNGPKVAFYNFGTKDNYPVILNEMGCEVIIYPAEAKAEDVLKADGVFLSDGPGNPKDYKELVEEVKKIYEGNLPVFAMGLGHQLLALAAGGDTHKMKQGHRGSNYPVKHVSSGKVYITGQGHGYEVKADSLDKKIALPSFYNVNDNTNEGLHYTGKKMTSIQFRPEISQGPQDMSFLFSEFISSMKEKSQEVSL